MEHRAYSSRLVSGLVASAVLSVSLHAYVATMVTLAAVMVVVLAVMLREG